MPHSQLAPYQTWTFWQTWALDSQETLPDLRTRGALTVLPELSALVDVPQDPIWHPEGDVWTHTILVCEQARRIAQRDALDVHERMVLMFAALCHDLGKAHCTVFENGRWRATKHAEISWDICPDFLGRINCPAAIITEVRPLVREHLVYSSMTQVSPRAIRRLIRRLEPASFEQLARLIEADHCGRPPRPKVCPPQLVAMQEMYAKLGYRKSEDGS